MLASRNSAPCRCVADIPGLGPQSLRDVLVRHGVSPEAAGFMLCADVHPLIKTLGRAGQVARADRRLLLDEYPPPPPRLPWWRGKSWLLWPMSAVGTLIALYLIFSPVWRFFHE